MKNVFMWVLVGYMVLDFMAASYRWMCGKPDMSTATLVLVGITHGFFVFGGLLVVNGVWT